MKNEYDKMSTPDLIEVVRTYEIDHKPDGWPAVPTCLITALANRLERSVGAYEEVCGKMVDFMARAAEAENAADGLALALKDAVSTYQGADKIVTAERQEAWDAALAEAATALQWRNGEALNKHKLALKEIRRAVVAVKRDYDVSDLRPDILEVDKDTLQTLFKIVNAHTKEENT